MDKKKHNYPVDAVYTWVDGSDENWLSKKNATLKKAYDIHEKESLVGFKKIYKKIKKDILNKKKICFSKKRSKNLTSSFNYKKEASFILDTLPKKWNSKISEVREEISKSVYEKRISDLKQLPDLIKKTLNYCQNKVSIFAKDILKAVNNASSMILLIDQKDSAGSNIKLFNRVIF